MQAADGQRYSTTASAVLSAAGKATLPVRPASARLQVHTPELLEVAVAASITPHTQPLEAACEGRTGQRFLRRHCAPGQPLPRSVLEAAFARVEGLSAWNIAQPAAKTQPQAGVLPVLGTPNIGALRVFAGLCPTPHQRASPLETQQGLPTIKRAGKKLAEKPFFTKKYDNSNRSRIHRRPARAFAPRDSMPSASQAMP